MATDRDDDDLLTGTVPAPDAEPTAAERSHARAFAELVDKSLTGRPMPPAMSADDRALLEVATVIRAGTGHAELSAEKRHSIVEDALRQAIGGKGATTSTVTPITRARSRRWAPWAIAGGSVLVAAAAVLLFWLRTPERTTAPATAQQEIPVSWRSRPADALIGPIARERVGDAATRIDTIFADRLDGFRERNFGVAARGRKP